MPVVFRHRGVRFYFFANEGRPREPIHIHADRADATAKFWLYPEVAVAQSFGYNRHELTVLSSIILARRHEIRKAWHERFGD